MLFGGNYNDDIYMGGDDDDDDYEEGKCCIYSFSFVVVRLAIFPHISVRHTAP
jgi:hypothetical protein